MKAKVTPFKTYYISKCSAIFSSLQRPTPIHGKEKKIYPLKGKNLDLIALNYSIEK